LKKKSNSSKPLQPNKEVKKKKVENVKIYKQKPESSRTKSNAREAIFTGLFVVAIIAMLTSSIITLYSKNKNTFLVRVGTISKEETSSCFIIRDEVVAQAKEGSGDLEKIVDEGKKVAKGENVFRYYSDSEKENTSKINELNKQIQTLITTSSEQLYSTETKLIDEQIFDLLSKINSPNDIQTIKENQKKLDELMSKKSDEIGKISNKDSEIKKLVDERNALVQAVNSSSTYLTSTKSGIVSYRIDNLEEKITTDNLSIYNEEYINNLNLKNGRIISSSENSGKIVNNFTSYIAFTSKSDEAQNAKLKQKAYIELPSGKVINATVAQINENPSGSKTIIFSITEGIDELLMYRKTNLNIVWWYDRGFRIPNTAIIKEGEHSYIIRSKGGYLTKVLVKIDNETDYYSIVSNYSTSEIKELTGVDKKAATSLVLYDEVLTKPTQEDIANTEK
jgi:hypothetical protein